MNASADSAYRTDLAAYVLDLLDFIEEKIAEAESDPASRLAALAEAAGAIPIIKDRLRREDQTVLTQLMLIGFIEVDLGAMAELPDEEFARKAEDFRRVTAAARDVVKGRANAPR